MQIIYKKTNIKDYNFIPEVSICNAHVGYLFKKKLIYN